MRIVLIVIAAAYTLNGLFMLFTPKLWYDVMPGVSILGPYNTHFVRDVALVYLVSSAGFLFGLRRGAESALLVAAAWPATHAIYHLWMWVGRNFALDIVALVNWIGIQAPAWLGLWAAWRMYKLSKS